jgi:HEAT repeat protein
MRIMRRHPTILLPFAVACVISAIDIAASAQPKEPQTPLQRQIEVQKNRLTSANAEERRDALMKLNLMRRPEAAGAAAASLNDADPSVRVAAAHALTSAPSRDAGNALIPLLQDKLEFVRREIAYALGESGSRDAIAPLANLLVTDKEMSVRAAAAVALGRIKDESAVMALAKAIDERPPKKKAEEYEFIKRAAVEALGEIRSPAGVPVLISALTNEKNSLEIRRVAATALGKIGSNSAVPALQAAFHSDDPYLAEAARAALRRMRAPLK